MAEFAYNNRKHASIGYPLLELTYKYYACISYEKDINPRCKSKVADELTKKLGNLMAAYKENLQDA